MRIVREYINEKFTQDSDPIHDMGIGMDALIKQFIEKETRYTYVKKDLLWICVECGKTEFVKYLLNKGYDVHANHDLTLRWASEKGDTETVKVLLNAGADVHARDDGALQLASYYGHTATVKVLKDWIAKEKKNVNEKFTDDSDPINDLSIGMDALIKRFIENAGYRYNKENLLWIFAKDGKIEFVKYLLNKGYDIHISYDAPLRLASYSGHTKIVKLLLDAGADVHTRDDEPLRYASLYGHTEIVKVLLNAGSDVHAQDDAALRWACERGHIKVVKVLLSAGAYVHINNDWPLKIASKYGHTEIVKILNDWIAKEKK